MMDNEIAYEVDEEGQDVLTIKDELNSVEILSNVLSLIPCPDR